MRICVKIAVRSPSETVRCCPWLHRVDVRFSQDVRVYGSNRVQLTFDILNFGNLLNNEWGVSKSTNTQTLDCRFIRAKRVGKM